jgi:hypothetical protein
MPIQESEITEALNGQVGQQLRKLVPLSELREYGAFFTGPKLAEAALLPFAGTLDERSVLLDPACGGGDLLIFCAREMARGGKLGNNLHEWGARLLGRDIHEEFAQTTRVRLALTAIRAGLDAPLLTGAKLIELFPRIEAGCGMSDFDSLQAATHIVINPPFSLVSAPSDCLWAGGKVNAAALFIEACLLAARPGTRVLAILPDVLRSGSRYKRWRRLVGSRARINRVELYGTFDTWADVDVFILELELLAHPTTADESAWKLPSRSNSECIRDRFDVCVGPVVDYRHPQEGELHPFLVSREMPRWGTLCDTESHRRFNGRLIAPPLVVVRRTSRQGDKHRAIGTIVLNARSLAVENHLLVLSPKDRRLQTCEELLQVLQRPETDEWLDRRIRCRHLTVSALGEIPWSIKAEAHE